MRERRINRRRQGDLGELSAMEWLAREGAVVWTPFGHSPNADLIAELDGALVRVQVKTTTFKLTTPDGHKRWAVQLATNGGNQSWSGVAKRFSAATVDRLFVLVGDGRRWFIPADAVEASNAIQLGGPKYSEFEIAPSDPIERVVYGDPASLESDTLAGEYPSGQRTATVNRQAQPSQVRILPPPSSSRHRPPFERKLGRAGQAVVRGKRQMTLPLRPFTDAGMSVGDRVRFRAEGPGRIVLERIGPAEYCEDDGT